MGSGSSGGYGNGGRGSQPYAPTYHVTTDMMARDKADSDIRIFTILPPVISRILRQSILKLQSMAIVSCLMT